MKEKLKGQGIDREEQDERIILCIPERRLGRDMLLCNWSQKARLRETWACLTKFRNLVEG